MAEAEEPTLAIPGARAEGPRDHTRQVREKEGGQPGQGGTHGTTSSTEVGLLVDALKSAAEHEFDVGDRLDASTRRAITVAGIFFPIVQTVVFGGLGLRQLGPVERSWVIVIALIAVGLLGLTALASAYHQASIKTGELPVARVVDDMNALYDQGDSRASGRLGEYYAGMVEERREANDARLHRYRLTVGLAMGTMVATSAELVVALTARLP